MGRCTGGLWATQDPLQPVRPLGCRRDMAAPVPNTCGGWWTSCRASPRQHPYQGAPLRRWRKRGRQIQAIGVSRGGRTTRIHALTDGLGRLVAFCLTAGHVADCRATEGMLQGLPHSALVMADRAYDINAIRQQIEQQVPSRTSRRGAPGSGKAASAGCSIAAVTPSSACSVG